MQKNKIKMQIDREKHKIMLRRNPEYTNMQIGNATPRHTLRSSFCE